MPNVNDHGLEVLKKAAIDIGEKPKTNYALQTLLTNVSEIAASGVATSSNQVLAQAQLQAINSNTDLIEPKLDTLIAKDFATASNQSTQINTLDLINSKLNTLGQKTSAQSVPVVFASDSALGQSAIADQGNLFSVATVLTAANASVDNPVLLIRNPAGSGKSLFIWRGRFGSTITNVAMAFKIFSNSTVTAVGTPLTVINRNIGGSNPATVALVTSLPSVSANGALITALNVGQNNNSIDMNEEFAIKLNQGNSLMITAAPSSNGREATVSVVWQEK